MGLTQKLGTIPLAILTDASNNVGIGAAPSGSYKLEVTGTAKVSSTLLVSGAATFSSTLTTTGIGINYTGTLAAKLHINADSSISYAPVITLRDTANPTFGFTFKLDTAVNGDMRIDRVNAGVDAAVMYFQRSTGNVGIGITPKGVGSNTTLEISDTGLIYAGGGQMAIVNNAYNNGSWIYKTTAAASIYATDGGTHKFETAVSGTAGSTFTYTTRMFINNSGNIGFGSDAPTREAVLYRASGEVHFKIANGTTGQAQGDAFDLAIDATGNAYLLQRENKFVAFYSNAAERMRIANGTDGGTVLIGRTVSPGSGYVLAVQEAMAMYINANGNNMVNFFNVSGTYVASIVINASTVSYGTGSDYRLKEDLKDFDGLDLLSKIKFYDFKFKEEGDRMTGVLAHELQEILPYAVSGEKDEVDLKGQPKIQNVDYSKLVSIQGKAIQELNERLNKAGL
jgi:hypothetical protein